MASDTPTSDSVIVDSTPEAVEKLCAQIIKLLPDHGYCKDDVFAVHLAMEEAFQNAVKHGNKMDPGKTVKVEYWVDSEKVEIKVTDEGPGFDPVTVPDPRSGPNLYKPDGRGLLLMKAYMDEVRYCGCGNCVYMVRYKQKPGVL